MKYLAIAVAALSLGLAGCGSSEVQVSKQEENDFRNPPKEIPPETLKKMQESRERGMKMAQEAMRKNKQGGN